MRAAPTALFDVPILDPEERRSTPRPSRPKVLHALYSVPALTPTSRKHVRVRADLQGRVKIYFGTELIKMHERQPPGGRATDPTDYPAHKSVYALRDVDRTLRQKAKTKGTHVGMYAERLPSGGPLPWTKMRRDVRPARALR